FRRVHLAADQAQNKLMIVLEQAGRIDQVRAANAIENVRDRYSRGDQARGIRSDLVFGYAAALNDDRSHSVETIDARLEVISGDFPKIVGRNPVRSKTVSQNRKSGE